LSELLSLPQTDPRIPELARQMTAGAETPAQKARAIEGHLRRDYGYTLELLSTPVDDPPDEKPTEKPPVGDPPSRQPPERMNQSRRSKRLFVLRGLWLSQRVDGGSV
jgi:hypothetical protein